MTSSFTIRIEPDAVAHHEGDQYPANAIQEFLFQCYPDARDLMQNPVQGRICERDWTEAGEAWVLEMTGDAYDMVYLKMATCGVIEI